MNKGLLIVLLIFLHCCNDKKDKQPSLQNAPLPKALPARGYVVPPDSMRPPKVVSVDEKKLKKIPAGQPKIIPAHPNVHKSGTPKTVKAGKPGVITPGTDTFPLPKVVPAIDSPFMARQPKPVPALPTRMKDAATCNMQYLDVDQGMNSSYVWSILEDHSGNLWFGTEGGGVTKYDGQHFTHYTEKEGLSNNNVWSILEDHSGNLWVSTERGLTCFVVGGAGFSTTKLHKKNEIFNPLIMVFHKEDGLKAEDFFSNSVLLDSKNRIWWGSGKALTMLDLNEFKMNKKEPEIQLDNIYLQENFVDYRHLHDTITDSAIVNENNELKNIRFRGVAKFHNYPEGLELPYYLNHLTFYFTGIDWYAPHKLKYQYKLEGLDKDWSQLTSEGKADYRNIPFGKYTFKVKAIGSAGKWSKTLEYSFIIHPPWWRTGWAYTSYVITAIAAVVLIVRWNSRKLRARAKMLKIKVEEATQEIRQQKEIVEKQKQLIEEKHKEITDSINYAERIQRSLLASKKLLDEHLKEYFILYKPRDVVSGDFYWARALPDGQLALMCADSTGHGVPGAIMSILNIACLEKAVEVEKLTMPHEILNYTRNKIIETLKNDGTPEGGKDGMDGCLLCFDSKNYMLTCASAHNPVWIVRGKKLTEIKADKFPVGKHIRDGQPFTLNEFKLCPGDAIYLLTDGFGDQFGGPSGKKFKNKNLQELLLSIAHEPMHIQKQKLEKAFENWKGSLEQVDDVTIMGIRI
ncbi:MAG: SpoIIE family protein phosphatase [Bacteroidia bacterium]|nr:SpoIIE family protein phosphatase [Bacteroidia bacterium]